MPPDPIRYYDRRHGQFMVEPILGDRLLRLAYLSPLRPLFRALLCRTGWLSRLLGWYCDQGISRHKIAATIAELQIDPAEFIQAPDSFGTFNEFFIRQVKPEARPFSTAADVFCSPADSRVLAYQDTPVDRPLQIKQTELSIAELLAQAPAAQLARLHGGSVVICRLCPADYHRYHYPCNGRVTAHWDVPGRLDSVNPLVLGLGIKVYSENYRRVWMLELDNFGLAAFVEVGAFGVGKIVQTHHETQFTRMQEKGMFRFGASSLVLVLEPGRLQLHPDLIEHTGNGIETLVRVGETLGHACK